MSFSHGTAWVILDLSLHCWSHCKPRSFMVSFSYCKFQSLWCLSHTELPGLSWIYRYLVGHTVNPNLCGVFLTQKMLCLFGCLVFSCPCQQQGYIVEGPKTDFWQFYVLPHTRQSGETMTSVSGEHIILTTTQPVGSGRTQRGSNPWPPY